MNKIIIEDEKIIKSDIEYQFNEKKSLFEISELVLNIKSDENLLLDISNKEESKLVIVFNVLDNINFNLVIITKGNKSKIQYKYNLGKKASCNIEKLNMVNSIREMIIASLEIDSTFNYIFKSIATNKENYD